MSNEKQASRTTQAVVMYAAGTLIEGRDKSFRRFGVTDQEGKPLWSGVVFEDEQYNQRYKVMEKDETRWMHEDTKPAAEFAAGHKAVYLAGEAIKAAGLEARDFQNSTVRLMLGFSSTSENAEEIAKRIANSALKRGFRITVVPVPPEANPALALAQARGHTDRVNDPEALKAMVQERQGESVRKALDAMFGRGEAQQDAQQAQNFEKQGDEPGAELPAGEPSQEASGPVAEEEAGQEQEQSLESEETLEMGVGR